MRDDDNVYFSLAHTHGAGVGAYLMYLQKACKLSNETM